MDQAITGTDPDGDALTFSKTAGPTYMTVSTTNATTGNIHLVAGASETTGTSPATVRATDTGGLFNEKTLTVTVNPKSTRPNFSQSQNMNAAFCFTTEQT